ncbi:hypothetical protein D3C85_1093170 [compost metagenome]
MTKAQVELLKRLIEADRRFHTMKANGQLVTRNERGIEVGKINGVDPRTADSLIDAGLVEPVDIGFVNTYIFLGKYDPYD